jgi:hypothetical protein
LKLKIITYLILFIFISLSFSGCIDFSNNNENELEKQIFYEYGFEITSNNNSYILIVPTLIDFNNNSILNNEDLKNIENINVVYINNTEYGIGLQINSSVDISFKKNEIIDLEKNDNFVQNRYYLSLATNYYEDIQKNYKNQGSEFYIYKNGTGNIRLKLYLKTNYSDGKDENAYYDNFDLNVNLINGWNLYYAKKSGSGD